MPSEVRHVFMSCDAVGGVWTYAVTLVRALARRGVRTTLAVVGPEPTASHRDDLAGVEGVDLLAIGGALDWTAERRDEVIDTERRLRALAAASRADVVHLNTPAFVGSEPWQQPVAVTAHSCLGTWWRAVKREAVPPDMLWRIVRTGEGLRMARLVFTPSLSFADELHTLYGAGLKISVVWNGLEAMDDRTEHVRSGILAAGRLWDEGKNFATLDAAGAGFEPRISVAGPLIGPNGEAISLVNLDCLGTLSRADLAQRMRGVEVFAAPSLYEPFGFSVLEAAQHGAVLVLADIPTFRELWWDAALFVPPRDEDAWRDAFQRLLGDKARLLELQRKARARAGIFTSARMADEVLNLYRSLITDETSRLEAEVT